MFVRRALYRNFRLLYRLSRRLRYRFTPNGMLILSVLIVSGVFGIDTRQTLAFQIFSICFLLLFISFIYLFSFRGQFTIKRQLPEHGSCGESFFYRCFIENKTSRIHRNLFIIDELGSHFPTFDEFMENHDPNDKNRNRFDRYIGYPKLANLIQLNRGGIIKPSTIDYLAAHGKNAVSFRLIPLRRGYLRFNRLRIGQIDPLGLMRSFKTYNINDKLLVLPKLYHAPNIPFKTRRLLQHGGVNLASSVGESHEFMSLRDYRPGDPLRSIHWRSYAKLSKPVVKEFQDEYFSRFGLVLDTFARSKTGLLFEEAVSVASSFVISMKHQDSLLDLLFIGTESFHFTSGRGLADTANMLEILANVKICHAQPFHKLTELINNNISKCSGLVCVLLDFDEDRKKFINLLARSDMPFICFIICVDESIIDDINQFQTGQNCIQPLDPEHIQNELDNLDLSNIRSQ